MTAFVDSETTNQAGPSTLDLLAFRALLLGEPVAETRGNSPCLYLLLHVSKSKGTIRQNGCLAFCYDPLRHWPWDLRPK